MNPLYVGHDGRTFLSEPPAIQTPSVETRVCAVVPAVRKCRSSVNRGRKSNFLSNSCGDQRNAAPSEVRSGAWARSSNFRATGRPAGAIWPLPTAATGPGVVVIQEWWGLVDHIEDVCDRFAAAGFVALAPDLYHGKGRPDEPDEAAKAMMAMQMEQAASDMSGAVDEVLRRAPGDKVGVIGFCMGGGLALVLATQRPDAVAAVVPCYGIIPWPDAQPDYAAISAAVLGHYAENDSTSRRTRPTLGGPASRLGQVGRDRRLPRRRPRVLQRHQAGGTQPRRGAPRLGQRHGVLSSHLG